MGLGSFWARRERGAGAERRSGPGRRESGQSFGILPGPGNVLRLEESWSCPFRQGRLHRGGPFFLIAPRRGRPCSGRRRLTVCTPSHFLLVAYAPQLPELAKPVPARVRGLTDWGGGVLEGRGSTLGLPQTPPPCGGNVSYWASGSSRSPWSVLLGRFRFCRQRPSQLVKPNFTTLVTSRVREWGRAGASKHHQPLPLALNLKPFHPPPSPHFLNLLSG